MRLYFTAGAEGYVRLLLRAACLRRTRPRTSTQRTSPGRCFIVLMCGVYFPLNRHRFSSFPLLERRHFLPGKNCSRGGSVTRQKGIWTHYPPVLHRRAGSRRGNRDRKKSRVASGITTQVSRTTRSVRNTTFWTRNGWLSRNGPVRSEIMIETGEGSYPGHDGLAGLCRRFEDVLLPGSVNQVSRPRALQCGAGQSWRSFSVCQPCEIRRRGMPPGRVLSGMRTCRRSGTRRRGIFPDGRSRSRGWPGWR